MAKPAPRRLSRLRRIFRWCRIFILTLILVIIVAGLHLNTIGLPDFLKKPLLARLHKEGVQVDFSRMRLRWFRGIVVDNATFTFLKHPRQPKFSSVETEINLDLRELRESKFILNSLTVKEGCLVWPVAKTNPVALTVSNIATRIEFPAQDKIDVTEFAAGFADTKISITGVVDNVSAARHWKIFRPKEPRKKGKGGLEKLAAALEKIHLTGSPEIKLQLSGDAAAPDSFKGNLRFAAPEAKTPWGNETNLLVIAELNNFSSGPEKNFIRITADSTETPWGRASNLNCIAHFLFSSTSNNTFQASLKLSAEQLFSKTGHADSVRLSANCPLTFTNFVPTNISGMATLLGAETKWGRAASAEISFSARTNAGPKIADESWALWRPLEPFLLNWEGRFSKIESPKLRLEKVSCAGTWRAPSLQIANLDVALYDGTASASAQLNVANREARARAVSDFDVQKISPLLTPFGQRWIAKYTWEKPPKLAGDLRVILPEWTNKSPSWRKEVLPTLELNGTVSVENGTYRAVSATSAKTDFNYSNMVWTLPHLRVDRPEGGADLNLVANDRTREYHWRIHSEIDPKTIRHLLDEKQQKVFDDFQFTVPPVIHADLYGHWNDMINTSVDGELVATSFSFRSNPIDKLSCSLLLTNHVLSATRIRVERGDKFITAPKVELDFPKKRIFFNDVYGTMDPYVITRMIGRKVAANIAPYQFTEPPAVRLNGSLSITNVNDADMHFLIDGNQFQWKNLYADKISGRLDWINETLLVTNLHANAYRNGIIEGWAYFNFAFTNGTAFSFDFAGSDIDLQSAISRLTGKTNHLEGLLHGQFTLESGNVREPKTWKGYGRANLRDGLIWDVPLFGIFSPVLNTLMPGAGNSRAREGSATYIVRDGIVYSDDLELRASGLRLQYRGGVDFQKNVDARVEAELLRDTWVIGPLLSLALSPITKVFEYKVTGTLNDPQSEPVYIPEILMMTLRPFHSLKQVLTPEKSEDPPSENPPAEKQP